MSKTLYRTVTITRPRTELYTQAAAVPQRHIPTLPYIYNSPVPTDTCPQYVILKTKLKL